MITIILLMMLVSQVVTNIIILKLKVNSPQIDKTIVPKGKTKFFESVTNKERFDSAKSVDDLLGEDYNLL